MAEKLCLRWNAFQENVSTVFGNLRSDHMFVDVTLACEDGQQVEAHKVILAASSPFFKNLLGKNKHSHPLIYMRGVSLDVLTAIVDFLYHGEANVLHNKVDSFLALSEELQLQGLTKEDGKYEGLKKADETNKKNVSSLKSESTMILSEEFGAYDAVVETYENSINMERTLSFRNLCTDFNELNKQIKTFMVQGKTWDEKTKRRNKTCTVCGKEGQYINIRNHIEANHMEGISIPCNLCEKTCGSRDSMRKHITLIHS